MSWIERFPGLLSLDKNIVDLLVKRSSVVSLPENTVIFGPGKRPENLLLLLEGSVRVQQFSEKGREIVLYRVRAGESCILTTACLLAYENYSAEGIAETAVEAIAIPRQVFDQLLADSHGFRLFVFNAYSKRITDLFHIIEEVAFQKLDIRLAQKLLELAQGKHAISATHHQLAAELGTAREVISRQLREFQRRDWITQERGAIALIDETSLATLAAN